jgi:hypothetical protein
MHPKLSKSDPQECVSVCELFLQDIKFWPAMRIIFSTFGTIAVLLNNLWLMLGFSDKRSRPFQWIIECYPQRKQESMTKR